MRIVFVLFGMFLCLSGCQISSSQATEPTNAAQTAPSATQNGQPPSQVAQAPAIPQAIQSSVVPQFTAVHLDSTSHLNVLLQLKAAQSKSTIRPNLDLAIVIDTSGSMRGSKMTDSKLAAHKLIDALSAHDKVTLIQYASDVRRMTFRRAADAAGKAQLKNQINALQSGGSTALGPALFDAFEALSTMAQDGTRLRHVILMSDGLANVGEKNPKVLAQRSADAFRAGISVTTLGVGLDYNEDLMTQVADEGGGRYHFIKDSHQIVGILGDELNSLVGTVARNVVVKFRGHDGIKLVKAFGYPTSHDGATSTVRVGFMGSEQSREIMMRVSLAPGILPSSDAGPLSFGHFAIDYVDVSADGVERRISETLTATLAESPEAMAKTEKTEVSVRLGELEANEKLKVAAASAGRGDFSGARLSLGSALQQLRVQNEATPSPKLQQQIIEFQGALDGIDAASTSSSGRKSYSKKYKARAYSRQKK